MKSDALSASSSIKELQDVWSHVETQLESFSYRLDNIDQYMRNKSLFIRGLRDIPKKKYGIDFSQYIIDKLKELFPSIADRIKLEDIDVSHPLPTKGTSPV